MIDWRVYQEMVLAQLDPSDARPFRTRRVLASGLGFPAWQAGIGVGRALDRVLAPGHRHQPIHAPVFIVGHHRSGTTFLHHLLANDPRFLAPRTWELLLPSRTLQRLAHHAPSALKRRVEALEQPLFAPIASRHTVHWRSPEEDDLLFVHSATSPRMMLLHGAPELSAPYVLDHRVPEDERAALMRWYRSSLQRMLVAAPERQWLSKNPFFTGWIDTLAEAFPDARFVMMVREPTEAIASNLFLVTRAWGGQVLRSDYRLRQLLDISLDLYRAGERSWAKLPESRKIRVRHDRLQRDPVQQVQRIYTHFDWDLDAETVAALQRDAERARRRVPAVPVKLRSFGIHPREVREALRDETALSAFLKEPR